MISMKRILIYIVIIFICFLSFSSVNNAEEKNICHNLKIVNNISTRNILTKYSKKYLSNIQKICSDDICSYVYDDNYDLLIMNHEQKYLKNINNFDTKNELKIKGIKINKLYFKECT